MNYSKIAAVPLDLLDIDWVYTSWFSVCLISQIDYEVYIFPTIFPVLLSSELSFAEHPTLSTILQHRPRQEYSLFTSRCQLIDLYSPFN